MLIGPALAADGRVLASPRDTTYPGIDDAQYVTTTAAIEVYKTVARDLRGLAGPRPTAVFLGDFTSNYLQIAFRDDPRFSFVAADTDDAACTALYAVSSDLPLPSRPDGMTWRELTRYPRPRDGAASLLYESGVRYRGRTAVTPDDLLRLIGSGHGYDRFSATRPCVRAWARAWHDHQRRPSAQAAGGRVEAEVVRERSRRASARSRSGRGRWRAAAGTPRIGSSCGYCAGLVADEQRRDATRAQPGEVRRRGRATDRTRARRSGSRDPAR